MIAAYTPIEEKSFSSTVGDFTFYFTMERHKQRFDAGYASFLEQQVNSFRNRFKISFSQSFYDVFIVAFYMRCETFGYLIEYKGREITAPSQLGFHVNWE